MFDSNKWAALWWILLTPLPMSCSKGVEERAQLQGLTLIYLNMSGLAITTRSVSQAQVAVVIGCIDNTGQTFSTVSVAVAPGVTTPTGTGASFNVDQQIGYLQNGRSIACSVDLTYLTSNGLGVTVVPLLAASNASCWLSYSLFVASGVAAGSSATAPSWTCSTSGVSYTLVCQSCVPPPPSTIASKSSTLSGLSTGQLQTICIVIGCMLTSMTLVMSAMRLDTCSVLLAMLVKRSLGGHACICLHEQDGCPMTLSCWQERKSSLVAALAVICICSRATRWYKTDVRDTRHLPEDAAKDVNLKPPGFFVASTASQRQCEGPASPEVPVEKAGAPPVVIVSYGSSSSPTVANFHHGFYSLAQPEVAHVQHKATGLNYSIERALQRFPGEYPIESSIGDQPNQVL